MLDELKKIVASQIEKGGCEEKIQSHTLAMIDSDEFKKMPESVQDAIYQLNMNDVNQLGVEEYRQLLDELNQ